MTVDEFLVWLEGKGGDRCYELVAGQPVAMVREPAAHARIKAQAWRLLHEGLESQSLPGEALPNGLMVKIDAQTACRPNALVRCDERLPDDAIIVPAPVIVADHQGA
jgi:Uma2 family endonuclease